MSVGGFGLRNLCFSEHMNFTNMEDKEAKKSLNAAICMKLLH